MIISYKEAIDTVLSKHKEFGTEQIELSEVNGRVLAADTHAGRDYPPFNRVAMDGIAIAYESWESGNTSFTSQGIQAAGSVPLSLTGKDSCFEVMTGAVLPEGCDTVIPYEHVEQNDTRFHVAQPVKAFQNVHGQGSDLPVNGLLLTKNNRLNSGSVALLATEGYNRVSVKALPKVALISTGDELVPIESAPLPHQIRTSNVPMIQAALQYWRIQADVFHVTDDKDEVDKIVQMVAKDYDASVFFGGVSKGKFDYLPEVFEAAGIRKHFHRVAQRPGKPMWFGSSNNHVVFAMPGNPISSWTCFHVYFLPWLKESLGMKVTTSHGQAQFDRLFRKPLTLFQLVKQCPESGQFELVQNNGSGDLTSLHEAEAILILNADQNGFEKGRKYRSITFE